MLRLANAVLYGAVALIGIPLFFLLFRFLRWYFSILRILPGPKNRVSILGNFPEIIREPTLEPHKRWWKEAGMDVRVIHYTLSFWRPSLLVLDKEIVRTILTAPYGKDDPRFYEQMRFLTDVIGEGLVTLSGKAWMRHRRIIQPSFQTSFLRESLSESVPPKVNLLIKFWQLAGDDREIDVNSHLSMLTLDIIGDVAFSHDFFALNAVEEWSKRQPSADGNDDQLASIGDLFIVRFNELFRIDLMTRILGVIGLIFMNRYVNPSLIKSRRLLDEAVSGIISDARTRCTRSKSLLHLLLQAKDPDGKDQSSDSVLSDVELRDEVKTFALAGHETTSTWLYWALFALAKYPDIQNRVYEDVLKHAPASVQEISLEHAEKMEYLKAFLQEVLRVTPPVAMFSRDNNYVENFDGLVVPPHTRFLIPVLLLHHHPKYWDKPDDFSPERWLNVSAEETERRRFAFLPFSAGGRTCIGQMFATFEAQLILAPLVRAFRVTVANSQRSTNFAYTTSITMKSKPLFKICVKKRQLDNS